MFVIDLKSINDVAFIPSVYEVSRTLLIVSVFLIPLETLFPSHSQDKPQRNDSRYLNFLYWFFTPLCTRLFTNVILVGTLSLLFFLQGRTLDNSFYQGFGPISRQPLWLQTIEILLLADFIEYWTHRTFHLPKFWKFHAIHHSPTIMNWLASARMHPVNDLVTRVCQVVPLVALGFSIKGIILIVPYLFFYVIFIHSNLNWDFGIFRYVLVSPLYHQWHHTSDKEGLDKNFSGIFPIWDILFGTCHFPKRSPKRFGVIYDAPPETLLGQLLYPFKRKIV